MKKLFQWIFLKTRTFKTNILTVFLSLLTISFICVISFTYPKRQQSILDFSRGVAERTIDLVVVRFDAIIHASERVAKASAGFLPAFGEISFDNQKLTSYLVSVVKNDPNFSNFYFGLPNGSFVGAFNQAFTAQRFYATDPSKPLPADAAYSLRYSNFSIEPHIDVIYYLNKELKMVDCEVIPAIAYDVRDRPWYIGAVKNKGLFWTDFYTYFISSDTGISLGNPVYAPNGDLLCVVGVDLSFVFLSDYVKQQKIGKTGKAFILSGDGRIIVPVVPHTHHNSPSHSTELVAQVFDNYEKENKAVSEFIVEQDGVKYLAYITPLTSALNKDWLITTVVPFDDFFEDAFVMQRQGSLVMIGILILSIPIIIYFAKRISTPIVTLAEEVNKIKELDLSSDTRVNTNIKEVYLIDKSIAAMRHVIRSFFKYVPKEIVSSLFEKNEEIALGGEIKELTIFFSDIADFTTIAENYSIDVLNPLLSEYFAHMTKIILHSKGTIDKFLSDGIMAFWGAPVDSENTASDACIAALRCNAMLATLNQRRREEGKPEFITRFGINTGFVIVGNIGTEDRMNYTVIGDAVNTTYRLLRVDKEYHTSILLSEDAKKHLSEDFVLRPLDVVEVKGKREKIKVYELMGKMWGIDVHPTEDQITLCRMFTEAYEAMDHGDIKQARSLFTAIAAKFPDDYPTQIYLKRLKEEHS
ncbi:MAG: hypothetical protein JSS60_02800 [Verrucomicrobia bacterium]|nr:hypothetical protein [Verrucomicrobiota bacterium]